MESSKNAPRHVVRVRRVSWKSAELIVQLRVPPKESVTFTSVSHAVCVAEKKVGRCQFQTGGTREMQTRTVRVVALKVPRAGLRPRDLREDRGDVLRGPADERRARVDGGVRSRAGREAHGGALHGDVCVNWAASVLLTHEI